MNVLFIGGTGTISSAITQQLAQSDHELYLINRGSRNHELPENVHCIIADINNEQDVADKIKEMAFDVVCDFIGFVPSQLERDYRLFKDKTKQFIYIKLRFRIQQASKRLCYNGGDNPCQSILGVFSQ